MKVFAATLLIAATAAVAQYVPCPNGLFSVPLCCETDALGILGLDCDAPTVAPGSAAAFTATCEANSSRDPKCCVAHLLGQAVLCINPNGIV